MGMKVFQRKEKRLLEVHKEKGFMDRSFELELKA
jgi:hypothetical protein